MKKQVPMSASMKKISNPKPVGGKITGKGKAVGKPKMQKGYANRKGSA